MKYNGICAFKHRMRQYRTPVWPTKQTLHDLAQPGTHSDTFDFFNQFGCVRPGFGDKPVQSGFGPHDLEIRRLRLRLVADMHPRVRATIHYEEVFGPIAPVITVKDEAAAIELANS